MTLMIENKQDTYNIEEIEKLAHDVYAAVLKLKNIDVDCQVGLTFTDNQGIQHINRDFRGIDSPTDVLSFPIINYEDGKVFDGNVSLEDMDRDTGEVVLGDIVISLEKAEEQSKEYGHSFQREIAFLMVHGMLHLFGYDHIEEHDRNTMRQEEERILGVLNLRR